MDRALVLKCAEGIVHEAIVKATADMIEAEVVRVRKKYPSLSDEVILDKATERIAIALRSGTAISIIEGRGWKREKDD